MRLVFIGFLVSILVSCSSVQKEKLYTTEDLISAIGIDLNSQKKLGSYVDTIFSKFSLSMLSKDFKQDVRSALGSLYSKEDFKKFNIDLYEKNFSKKEIHELTKFYKSSLGSKSLKILPTITKETMNYTQMKMKNLGVGFKDLFKKYLQSK